LGLEIFLVQPLASSKEILWAKENAEHDEAQRFRTPSMVRNGSMVHKAHLWQCSAFVASKQSRKRPDASVIEESGLALDFRLFQRSSESTQLITATEILFEHSAKA